jgi:hypothetical protein
VNVSKVSFTANDFHLQQMNFKTNAVCKQNSKEHIWEICIFETGKHLSPDIEDTVLFLKNLTL